MEQITYLDFDMLIESVEGGYAVRVLNSPAGEASAKFVLPFSDLELDNIALQLGRTRRGVRRLESPEMEVARNFGRRLFEAVFIQGVRDRLRGSLGSVNRQGHGLRIRLRLVGAPELANLPWEYLYDPSMDRFLVLSVQTPLVRYLEVPQPDRPLSVNPPLNVAVMISSPTDYSPLEVEREWQNLKKALGSMEQRGLISLHLLETATLEALLREIRKGEYHIFHYIGHGGFDRQAQDGLLVLEDHHHKSRPVSGRYLGTILHDHRSMRLAILNACEGARTSRNDPFAGVAQSLVQQGIPSVIAMQFEITDEAAITFSRELYGAIADGYPVDAALGEARKAIFAQDNDVEWGTPVLYLYAPDGNIFDVIPTEILPSQAKVEEYAPDLDTERRIDELYTEGLSAFWLEEWEKASQQFRGILELQPDHEEASSRLAEAERQLKLKTLYEEAEAAESEADWGGAQKALEQLITLDPDYKDVSTRIDKVKQQRQLAELYSEAQRLHQAGKWQAVITVFANILAIDPDYPDPENLSASAKENAAAEKRQAELESLYSRAVREMDAENWETAQALFRQVKEIEPGFRQTKRLLDRIEAELSRQTADQERQDKIAGLFEEARNLAKINQWGQVSTTMQKIIQLDPLFPDPDGLANRAKEKLEKENQQVEQAKKLAALYSEAVQLTQVGKNEEALAKWEEIQSLDANYPDNKKVFDKATQGLIIEEGRPKSPTMPINLSSPGMEWSIVVIAYGWLLAVLLIALISRFIEFPVSIYFLLIGLFFGSVLWVGLRMRLPSLNLIHLAALIIGWGITFALESEGVLFSNASASLGFTGITIRNAIAGLLGGLVTSLVIYRAAPETSKARLGAITIGWIVGLILGDFVYFTIFIINYDLAFALSVSVVGLIGGWVTLEAIQTGPIRKPRWIFVASSILGFTIGVVLVDLIFSTIEVDQAGVISLILAWSVIAIWGSLSGASLAIPTRNFRKIALLGGAGAGGMILGLLIWNSLATFNDSILWHLDDLHGHHDINLFLGLGLGLALGLSIRRITAAMILPLVGAGAFTVATWTVLNWEYPSWEVRAIVIGIIIGGILGLAWGYLERPAPE